MRIKSTNHVKQKVYKILMRKDNVLTSPYVIHAPLVYTPNELVRPKFGKIFVFSNMSAALEFDDLSSVGLEIWEAWGFGASQLPYRANSNCFLEELVSFWEQTLNNTLDINYSSIYTPPLFTLGCASIRLIRRVDNLKYARTSSL